MPDPTILETFPAPVDTPFVIEHVAAEFTSLCPKTGHPDFGEIILRYSPAAQRQDGLCVELKSLKLYYQSFRSEGIFYEAVTNTIRDDLVNLLQPRWLQVASLWKGRGGVHSAVVASHGEAPAAWCGPAVFKKSDP